MELDLLLPGQFRVVPAEVSEKGMKLRRRRPDISAETSRLNSVFNCATQLNLLRSGFGEETFRELTIVKADQCGQSVFLSLLTLSLEAASTRPRGNFEHSASGVSLRSAKLPKLDKQEHIMNTTSASNPTSPDTSAASLDSLNAILAQNWWAVALRGVLGIVFGLIAFFFPGPTMLSFVLVFAAYALADGVIAIVAAIRAARRRDRWGFLTFEGIVSIAAAILAVLWPGLTLLIFVVMVAAWAIVTGALMFAASRNLDTDHGRWWLALGGLVSIVFGVLLVAAPLIGAVVLTWWIGAYAFGFGIALLILGFRLRSCRMNRAQDAVAHGAT